MRRPHPYITCTLSLSHTRGFDLLYPILFIKVGHVQRRVCPTTLRYLLNSGFAQIGMVVLTQVNTKLGDLFPRYHLVEV